MRVETFVPLLVMLGCASPGVDQEDGEAEGAGVVTGDVGGAGSLAGLYAGGAAARQSGDLTALELRITPQASGSARLDYIRTRCYGTDCNRAVPQTDRFDIYTSSAGRTYVRFWSVAISHDANGSIDSKPELADVYEIKTGPGTLELRKSYTSRWVTLGVATASAQCVASGGNWADGTCGCAGAEHFVAGAGGCISIGGASEQRCDDSGGLWTDDDATLLGEYCVCGVGRYDDAAGSCAAIDQND